MFLTLLHQYSCFDAYLAADDALYDVTFWTTIHTLAQYTL